MPDANKRTYWFIFDYSSLAKRFTGGLNIIYDTILTATLFNIMHIMPETSQTSQQAHQVEDQALSDIYSDMHSTHQFRVPEIRLKSGSDHVESIISTSLI